jgi:hypothetical protein
MMGGSSTKLWGQADAATPSAAVAAADADADDDDGDEGFSRLKTNFCEPSGSCKKAGLELPPPALEAWCSELEGSKLLHS